MTEDEYREDKDELKEILEDLDMFISPSTLRTQHTDYTNYHKFMDNLIDPMIEDGELVEIPNSTKGKLIQTNEKAAQIMVETLRGSKYGTEIKA